MSTAIAKNFQVGSDSTATNNFTIRQPTTPDGTVRIANGNSGTTTDLVTVTSAGNVGIGTSSPTSVSGYGALTLNGTTGSFIALRTNGTDTAYVQTNASSFDLKGVNNVPMILYTNNTEKARITSGGDLLVGTTSGSNLITASKNQSGNTPIINAINTNNTAGNTAIQATLGANCNTNTSAHFSGLSGASAWYLLGNGTITYSSDLRLKKNVETTRSGYLEDLCKLRVVKYNWVNHDDSAPKELGLIAQEVEQVFPGLVQDDLRGNYQGVTYKTIKGSVIPMMLLKAIQELKAELDSVKTELALLKGTA